MKKIVLFALGLVAVATAHAQDEKAKVETTVAADFVTQYIWRVGLGKRGIHLY